MEHSTQFLILVAVYLPQSHMCTGSVQSKMPTVSCIVQTSEIKDLLWQNIGEVVTSGVTLDSYRIIWEI